MFGYLMRHPRGEALACCRLCFRPLSQASQKSLSGRLPPNLQPLLVPSTHDCLQAASLARSGPTTQLLSTAQVYSAKRAAALRVAEEEARGYGGGAAAATAAARKKKQRQKAAAA